MDFQHTAACPHCAHGCTHPHEECDPFAEGIIVGLCMGPQYGLAVPGSRMRRGGSFTDPRSGITIGTDRWHRTRCNACRGEAMTPVEMLPVFPPPAHDDDGAVLMLCGMCMSDMQQGHRPGTNRHRRRRRAHSHG